MTADMSLLTETEFNYKSVSWPVLVSFCCHIAIFAGITMAPFSSHDPFDDTSVIRVSINTALPVSTGGNPKSVEPVVAEPLQKEVAPEPPEPNIEKIDKKVSEIKITDKPTPVPKKITTKKTFKKKVSLKKKTYNATKVKKAALQNIENKVKTKKPAYLSAIEKLKRKVGNTSPPSSNVQGAGTQGVPGRQSTHALRLIDLYRVEISLLIRRNWAFSAQLANEKTNLETRIIIKVKPNGQIYDIWFDSRSGNRFLDDSAKNAILKSNPLPPHPDGISLPFVEVGFRFTPEGLS